MTKIEWIKSQLIQGEAASDAASRLNTPIEIDNPNSQEQVRVPIDMIELRSEIPDAEAFRVLESRIWDRITDALNVGDLITVNNHVKALLAGGLISQATVDKLSKFLSSAVLDPNWQPKISISPAQLAGYDLVLVSEIESAIGD